METRGQEPYLAGVGWACKRSWLRSCEEEPKIRAMMTAIEPKRNRLPKENSTKIASLKSDEGRNSR